jgi:hypothetical protein
VETVSLFQSQAHLLLMQEAVEVQVVVTEPRALVVLVVVVLVVKVPSMASQERQTLAVEVEQAVFKMALHTLDTKVAMVVAVL